MNEIIYIGAACACILAVFFGTFAAFCIYQEKKVLASATISKKSVEFFANDNLKLKEERKQLSEACAALQELLAASNKDKELILYESRLSCDKLQKELSQFQNMHRECIHTIDRIRTDHSNEIRRLAATIREIEFDRNQFRDLNKDLNVKNSFLRERLFEIKREVNDIKLNDLGLQAKKLVAKVKKVLETSFQYLNAPTATDGGCFNGSAGKASDQVAKNYVDLSARTIDKNGPKQTACFSRAGVDIIVEVSEITRPIPRPQSSDECKASTLLTH